MENSMTSFERSRKRRSLLTLNFAKRHTSKSSRYNATMRYASYSLHARLRFSRWMHELSTARFQSTTRVKMRDRVSFRERGKFHDVVRTFQKRRKKNPQETGWNRFCTQTRLKKRAIIVSINPNRHCHHNRSYCMTF